MTPTFVLVHGSNGNSFSWAPLQRELALLGHRSLAVDLPGHGFAATFPAAYQAPQDAAGLAAAPSVLAKVTLDDYVGHVTDVVRRVRAHGPVVVVGHSLGGMTLTGLGNTVPELVDRLVYISAWCCVAATAAEYVQSPEFADSLVLAAGGAVAVASPAELGAIRLNWRTADPEALALVKAATMADGTDSECLAFLNTLEPDESFRVSSADVRAEAATWGRIPRTYVRLAEDRSIPVALQDRFIAEADALTPDNPFDVRTIVGSHAKFLVQPSEAAGILAGLASAGEGTR